MGGTVSLKNSISFGSQPLVAKPNSTKKKHTPIMSAPQAKILSQAPTELELQVAQAFIDLENSSPELKADLRPLQFKSIREVCPIAL